MPPKMEPHFFTLFFASSLIRKRRANPGPVRPAWSDWGKFAPSGIAGQMLAQLGMTWGISKPSPTGQSST